MQYASEGDRSRAMKMHHVNLSMDMLYDHVRKLVPDCEMKQQVIKKLGEVNLLLAAIESIYVVSFPDGCSVLCNGREVVRDGVIQ
jgi:hypothetical protein